MLICIGLDLQISGAALSSHEICHCVLSLQEFAGAFLLVGCNCVEVNSRVQVADVKVAVLQRCCLQHFAVDVGYGNGNCFGGMD